MEKQQVFYIHGGESFVSQDDFLERLRTKDIWDLPTIEGKPPKWTEHFAADLGAGYEVFTPRMPNAQNASFEEWKTWFERHFAHLHDGLILIGCSLGAMFLAKYLSHNTTPFTIKALFIMAAPVAMNGFDLSDAADFTFTLDDVPGLKDRAERVYVWQSKDDFLVPYEHAIALADAIPGSELTMFEDKNHFLVPELPELIEAIKAVS